MYKVFINERPFVLSTGPIIMHGGLSVQFEDAQQLKALLRDLIHSPVSLSGINVYAANLELLKQAFFSLFTIIEAAGGIVINTEGKYLFIKRLGFWDLPKGKLDKGETIEGAAVREVEEECGINGLVITAPAGKTYHTYEHKGWDILKITHWFTMHTSFAGTLVPQAEEGISEACWFDKGEIQSVVLLKTYVSIGELVRREIL